MVMALPVGAGGSVTFTLPTVFNPRYSPNFEAGSPKCKNYNEFDE